MTKEVLTLALEALKLSDTVFYPQTKIAIAAIERALANHIEDNLAMVAQPTPAEYAMGYAEGFNDACKPKQGEPVTENGLYRLGYHNGYGFGEAYGKANAQQRTWVGLTDEERKEIWWSCEQQTPTTFVKAIEQALKEKNV